MMSSAIILRGRGLSQVQGQPWLHIKFQHMLGYRVRSCLKEKKSKPKNYHHQRGVIITETLSSMTAPSQCLLGSYRNLTVIDNSV